MDKNSLCISSYKGHIDIKFKSLILKLTTDRKVYFKLKIYIYFKMDLKKYQFIMEKIFIFQRKKI